LNVAIAEVKRKTDFNISLESLEQGGHGWITALTFAINARTISKGKTCWLEPVMPPDLANQFNPSLYQADFTYSITPIAVEIQDTGKGKKSVLEDLEGIRIIVGSSPGYSRTNIRCSFRCTKVSW
jgi:hypothetical protein